MIVSETRFNQMASKKLLLWEALQKEIGFKMNFKPIIAQRFICTVDCSEYCQAPRSTYNNNNDLT